MSHCRHFQGLEAAAVGGNLLGQLVFRQQASSLRGKGRVSILSVTQPLTGAWELAIAQ